MDLVIRNNDEIVFLDENTVGAINKIELDEEKIIEIDTILDKFMLNYNCRYLKDLSKDKEIKEENKEETKKVKEDIKKGVSSMSLRKEFCSMSLYKETSSAASFVL